mgnify:CR=1 FL=1
MRIHRFILATSAIVAALFFGGAYWALDRVFDNIVRDNAARSSESAARITFAAMYQLMSKGWSRSQADNFLRDVANAGGDDSMQVQIYRGAAVEELYGIIAQPPLDDTLRAMYHIAPETELSPLACAYARARGADRMSSFGDWIALSDVCDLSTAKLIQHEVSDGIIAPGYDADALEVLKSKKKGGYAIVQIDADYEPKPLETRTVFGVTFEQGRQDLDISNETMLQNIVTENKVISDEQRRDLIISLIVLKYTQSNSVCYVQDGQTIGVGAGQQSRVHCTRLAGQKADNWQLRHMPKVLDLPFRADIAKPNRDNAIDVYIGDTPEDVIGDDVWAETFTEQPAPLTAEEKRTWLDAVTGVSLGSDAFFPFGDNIERARRSGVTAIVQPGGSIRDQQVIDTCNKYGIAMAFCGLRLFHH